MMSSELLSNPSSYCLGAFKCTDLALVRVAWRLDPTDTAAEPRKSSLNVLESAPIQKLHEMTRSLWVPQSYCCWLAVWRCLDVRENSKTFALSSALPQFA